MADKTIKGNYEIISNMDCTHDLDIIEENHLNAGCISIILECSKCKSKFKGIVYEEN